MNALRFVLRSLVHHRRSHAGVLAGSVVAAAVLVGALLVGDSVRLSLAAQSERRIGRVDQVLLAGDRLVRSALADDLARELEVPTAPVFFLPGIASADGGRRRALGVQVLGVDDRFFQLDLAPDDLAAPAPGELFANVRLARQLEAEAGDTVLLRMEKPSAMPRDTALAANEDLTVTLRVKLARVLSDEEFGRFSLQSHQIPPYNAVVALGELAGRLDVEERCNLVLTGGGTGAEEGSAGRAREALAATWTLDDLELAWRDVPELGLVELMSERVFLDDALAEACATFEGDAVGVLTYFVNGLAKGDVATPYSMVAGIGALGTPDAGSGAGPGGWSDVVPPGPPGGAGTEAGIVAGRWLADDLSLVVGDELELSYHVLGPQATLVERSTSFPVRGIVEPTGWAADPLLMPEFPGLAGSDHCREWEPGTPVDLERIRDKDETYWDERRGTPKAFLSLAASQELWGNRFGSLTAVRIDPAQRAAFEAHLRAELDPARLGIAFEDLRARALASRDTATDFGGLFVGLSFFLIVAALLLVALLYALAVELRSAEVGTLLAVGVPGKRIRRLFLLESGAVTLLGAAVGTVCGVAYTRAVLMGLSTVWSEAVGAAAVELHVQPATLVTGALSSVAVSVVALWLGTRRLFKKRAVELLGGGGETDLGQSGALRPRLTLAVALLTAASAVALVLATDPDGGPAAAGAFFGAGSLLLVSSLTGCRLFLARLGLEARWRASLADLGRRNCGRRRARSLATIALLASGTFLVLSVSVHRLGPPTDVGRRASGTGGFSLIGTSSMPVLVDLNGGRGREAFALEDEDWDGVSVVPMRVNDGDEASCLNLHLSSNPRLVGVRPDDLGERGAFRFARTVRDVEDPWTLLDWSPGEPVPAIGDHASLTWALHKKVGDVLEYEDERGATFDVRIVGTLVDSVLQGNLLIPEAAFEARFPSQAGYRMFLVDAPAERADAVSDMLGSGLEDLGLELTSTAVRLDEFHSVQNTYLVIFQMLGGLGLLLGSVGLGMVLMRNAFERRGEFAILRAVGFSHARIRTLVLSEHTLLLLAGVGCGTLAAVVALLPSLGPAAGGFPWLSAAGFLALVLANGFAWNFLATRAATRGTLLNALRKE